MKTEIKKLLTMKHFFKVLQGSDDIIAYTLTKPSQILMKNIHINWLKYLYAKTQKQLPVYLNSLKSDQSIFGVIKHSLQEYNEDTVLKHGIQEYSPEKTSELQFNLYFPQQEAMQHFVKWQRYRKYWWSSISTTPSLFSVNDIKHVNNTSNVDIVAQLPSGMLPVESITIKPEENVLRSSQATSCLSCKMTLEIALFTLLLDGLTNNTKEEYLRLHRNIAPYKISFALDFTEEEDRVTLSELATLLYHKLEAKKIISWLPDFSLPLESQMKENLSMGVTYTAVLNKSTLENGIFKLVGSSTMLGEQVHVADFDKYAAIIFGK